MDLYIWLGPADSIVGFQLAYDKPHAEKALTWRRDSGFLHTGVDDGARPGRHPETPLLVADGELDGPRVLREFTDHARDIDPVIVTFVVDVLARYPETQRESDAVAKNGAAVRAKRRVPGRLLAIVAIAAACLGVALFFFLL